MSAPAAPVRAWRPDATLDAFAAEHDGPPHDAVRVEGGGTHAGVGGTPDGRARVVRAPAGVVALVPDELTVRVRAGTPVADLDAALAEVGQEVPLDPHAPERATVGGVLAAGVSGLRRLRYGPVRDTLLEARVRTADGAWVLAGGPTVKNVSGFDLARLLVGSLGRLGSIAEVVLRARPRPAASVWLAGSAAPADLRRALFAPSALLWDGERCWVLVEGHPADVDAEARTAAAHGLGVTAGPPPLGPHRHSVDPAGLAGWAQGRPAGSFVAEWGVGTVHTHEPAPPRPVAPGVLALHRRLLDAFDPHGRLNPGRDPLRR